MDFAFVDSLHTVADNGSGVVGDLIVVRCKACWAGKRGEPSRGIRCCFLNEADKIVIALGALHVKVDIMEGRH